MRIAVNANCDARRRAARPTAVQIAQVACPAATPTAVRKPLRRPPRSALRIVSAVSGPGVTITTAETARNVRKWGTSRLSRLESDATYQLRRAGPDDPYPIRPADEVAGIATWRRSLLEAVA